MIQLYSDEFGYADLGNADITISLQNPYQHFFEEPEDFSYSFEVPMSEQNLKIFNKGMVSVMVDNYKIIERFNTKILKKGLTTMDVSIYKTRVRQKPEAGSGTYLCYVDLLDGWKEKTLTFYPLKDNKYNVKCKVKPVWIVKTPIFTWRTNGDWIRGEDKEGKPVYAAAKQWTRELRTVKDVPFAFRFIELEVPYKAFLTYLLGYIPEGVSDEQCIVIPIDVLKFKIKGTIELSFSGYKSTDVGSFRRVADIEYHPKYSNNPCRWAAREFIDRAKEGMVFEWQRYIYQEFPFSADRSNIVLSGESVDKDPMICVENSYFPATPIEDLQSGDRVEGMNNYDTAQTKMIIDVDQDVNLASNVFKYLLFDVCSCINQFYEDFARELPVLCDYNNIPETLFRESVIYVQNRDVLSYKEEEILEENWEIKRFGYEEYWAPYQYTRHRGEDVKMVCTDMLLKFKLEYNQWDGKTWKHIIEKSDKPLIFGFTGYCNNLNTEQEYDLTNVPLHPNRKKKDGTPVSMNTVLFWINYVQGDTTRVELEMTNYDFSSRVIIGDRYFKVDKVETKDFKTFKLTLIEYYDE